MKKLRFLWPAAITVAVIGCGYNGSSDAQRDSGGLTQKGIAATKDPRAFDQATGGGPETTPGGEGGTAGYALPERDLRRPGQAQGTTPAEHAGGSAVAGGSNGPDSPAMGTTGTRGDIQGTGGERY